MPKYIYQKIYSITYFFQLIHTITYSLCDAFSQYCRNNFSVPSCVAYITPFLYSGVIQSD